MLFFCYLLGIRLYFQDAIAQIREASSGILNWQHRWGDERLRAPREKEIRLSAETMAIQSLPIYGLTHSRASN